MITASALPRVAACPGSAHLSKAHVSNENADEGHLRHEAVEDAVLAGDLEGLPPKVAALIEPGATVLPEVAIAYNWRTSTARMIGRGAARDYTPSADEIPGTIDLLIVNPGNRLVVVDYKGFEDVGAPDENAQVITYGLAATRIYGASEVLLVVAYIGQGVEHARVVRAEAGPIELAGFAAKVRRIMEAAVPGAEVRESKACKYCPSKSVCPSKVGLLVQVAERGLAVIGDVSLTPERAAAGVREIERIEQLVRDARKRLEVYVDEQGPIDLGSGRFYGRYRRPGNERLEGAAGVTAIAEVVPEPVRAQFAAIAISYSTSKAAIERAAKDVSAKGKAAKLARAVVEKIRELGGAGHGSDSFPIGEFSVDQYPIAEREPIDTDAVDKLLTSAG